MTIGGSRVPTGRAVGATAFLIVSRRLVCSSIRSQPGMITGDGARSRVSFSFASTTRDRSFPASSFKQENTGRFQCRGKSTPGSLFGWTLRTLHGTSVSQEQQRQHEGRIPRFFHLLLIPRSDLSLSSGEGHRPGGQSPPFSLRVRSWRLPPRIGTRAKVDVFEVIRDRQCGSTVKKVRTLAV